MKEIVDFENFAKLDLQAGSIISVEPVPKSIKLLKFVISFGAGIEKTILSGIGPLREAGDAGPGTYAIPGQKVVAILNFAPRSMMGMISEGMLLSSKSADGQYWLLSPGFVVDGSLVG